MEPPTVPDAHLFLIGKLVLESQRLEEALKYLLISWDLVRGGTITTEEDAQRRVEDRTFASKFLARAHKGNLISETVQAFCTDAFDQRNRVVHRLIRERGTEFMTPEGKVAVFRDISKALEAVMEATNQIAVPLVQLGQGAGLPTWQWEDRANAAIRM